LAYEKIRYEVAEGGVATITLDDPETRNALGNQTLDELIVAFEAARDDDAVRCVVLDSSHEKVFSAGGNLEGFAAEVPLVHKHFGTGRFPRLFRLIGELGKPTLCVARGHVLAGALGLALACDLIVASESARFATPEIDVGVSRCESSHPSSSTPSSLPTRCPSCRCPIRVPSPRSWSAVSVAPPIGECRSVCSDACGWSDASGWSECLSPHICPSGRELALRWFQGSTMAFGWTASRLIALRRSG
jgi:hypothetical protein